MKADPFKLKVAAMLGFLAVTLGAMGAHGLETKWVATLPAEEVARRIEVWKTASLYHLVHAIVLFFLSYVFARADQGKWIWNSFFFGVLIFSGSLYTLCYTGIKWLGAITPIGGLLMMIGWLLLAMSAGKKQGEVISN